MKTIILFFAALIVLSGCATIKPNPVKTICCKSSENPFDAAKSKFFYTNYKVFWMMNTGSMKPLIDYRDTIVVNTDFDFEDLKPGDIAVYTPNWSNYTVTHMCYDKFGGNWRMYGINNGTIDPSTTTEKNYVGKVIIIYKFCQQENKQ